MTHTALFHFILCGFCAPLLCPGCCSISNHTSRTLTRMVKWVGFISRTSVQLPSGGLPPSPLSTATKTSQWLAISKKVTRENRCHTGSRTAETSRVGFPTFHTCIMIRIATKQAASSQPPMLHPPSYPHHSARLVVVNDVDQGNTNRGQQSRAG